MDHFGKAMPMPMFNFWNSNSRGCDKVIAVDIRHTLSDCAKPVANVTGASELLTPVSPKKRRPEFVDTAICSQAKRAKTGHHGGLPSPTSACADGENVTMSRKSGKVLDVERAKDVIQYQFGLEILMKHDELRLIEQELAKSMTALEQLRRCHLIPYPVQCPTPGQMLEISSGKGPALQSRSGQPVPKWAPPFGVVEGPYARHYAKWLIPDPIFDGIQPEARGFTETSRARNAAAEGRTTRNSMSDVGGFGKQRPARGNAGQRLQALSSGYPPVKDKQSPCTVKRSDGITVKLVCIDCHRWDFSSTQGFINHCRIAHKRDFKSHEEAAVHCGHPIEVDDSGAVVPNGNKTAPPGGIGGPAPGLVHPLARSEPISDQQAYKDVLSRINVSLELYHAGKLPNVNSIPGARKPSRQNASSSSSSGFVGSSDAPYLSQLMQKKNLGRNLQVEVKEAKSKEDWDLLSPSDDYDVDQLSGSDGASTSYKPAVPIARTPAVMRMPARSAVSPSEPPAVPRPASSKSHAGAPSGNAESFEVPETPMYDDDMEVELSPNTLASNNAPSLVSDDGEYDDSDDGSSDSSDAMETESVSDVAEINIEEDSDERVPTPRSIRRVEKPNNKKNDEARHVTFVTPSPVPSTNTKGRRKQKV